ncbi:MAG: hypothetical protein AAF581_10700 [Planctomycetota bacterium]
MSKHSPQDRRLLQELIRQERLTREEAQELLDSLELHQVRNARVRLPDILVKKEIITVSELAQLTAQILEEEEEDAVVQGRQPYRPKAALAPAPAGGGGAGRMVLVGLSVVSILVLGGVIFWLQNRDEPVAPAADDDLAAVEEPVDAEPSEPEAPAVEEPPKVADPLEQQLRGELANCLLESDLRKQIDLLDDLYTRSASHLPVDSAIRRAQKEAREKLNEQARIAFDEAKPRWQAHLEVGEFSEAVAIVEGLLSSYGVEALDGEIQHQRSLLQQDLERYCERLVRAGKRAFRHDNLPEAKKSFSKILGVGSRSQIAVAETWLRQIADKELANQKKAAGGNAEKSVAKKNENESDGGSDSESSSESEAGSDDEDDEEFVADEPAPVDPRIVAIREKLHELLPAGRATLQDNGTLVVTYDLGTKDPRNGDDWLPEIEGASLNENIRWSHPREEDGVRVSNKGYYRNRARLMPPIKFDVTFHNMTSFSPKNVMALAWVNDRGVGVATNMGQQTGYVKAGRVGSLKGRLFPYAARMNYKLTLEVGENEFEGVHSRRRTKGRPRKKGQENGVCTLFWHPQVMGVLTEMRIEGKLDLDWAESQLQ